MSLEQQNEIMQIEKRIKEEEFHKYQAAIAEMNRKRTEAERKQAIEKQDAGTSPLKSRQVETSRDNDQQLQIENERLKAQLREALVINGELEDELASKEARVRELEQRNFSKRDSESQYGRESIQFGRESSQYGRESSQYGRESNQYGRETNQNEIDKIVAGHRLERKSWEETERALKNRLIEMERELERSREESKKFKGEYNRMKDLIQGNVKRIITQTFQDHENTRGDEPDF